MEEFTSFTNWGANMAYGMGRRALDVLRPETKSECRKRSPAFAKMVEQEKISPIATGPDEGAATMDASVPKQHLMQLATQYPTWLVPVVVGCVVGICLFLLIVRAPTDQRSGQQQLAGLPSPAANVANQRNVSAEAPAIAEAAIVKVVPQTLGKASGYATSGVSRTTSQMGGPAKLSEETSVVLPPVHRQLSSNLSAFTKQTLNVGIAAEQMSSRNSVAMSRSDSEFQASTEVLPFADPVRRERLPDLGYRLRSTRAGTERSQSTEELVRHMLHEPWRNSRKDAALSEGFKRYMQAEGLIDDPRLSFAYALLLEKHLRPKEAVVYLMKSEEMSRGQFASFLRPRRRLVVVLSKLGRWEEAALECHDLMKQVDSMRNSLSAGKAEEYAQFAGDVYGYLAGPLDGKTRGQFDVAAYMSGLPKVFSQKQVRQFEQAQRSALEKFQHLVNEDSEVYGDLVEKAPVTRVSDQLVKEINTHRSVRTPVGRGYVGPYYWNPWHAAPWQLGSFLHTSTSGTLQRDKSIGFRKNEIKEYDKRRRIRVPAEAYKLSNYVRPNLELEKRHLLKSFQPNTQTQLVSNQRR